MRFQVHDIISPGNLLRPRMSRNTSDALQTCNECSIHSKRRIGSELRKILDHTKPDKTVDLGAHSLGTSLALTAFHNDPTLQDRIHQSYLFNPAFSPLSKEGNITDKYESDDRVCYFIDLSDPVSVGDLGSKGPSNVVYRNNWNPFTAHKLVQWGGETGLADHDVKDDGETPSLQPQVTKGELPVDYNHDGVPDPPRSSADDVGDDGGNYVMDFGDDFDGDAWSEYFE